MDCVKIKDTPIFDGDNDNEDTKDPFDNSGDDSICDYDCDSGDDPFKEDKEYEPKNIGEPFKIKDENKSQDASILTDEVVRKTPSAGATSLDFTKLAKDKYSCNHCEHVTNNRNNVYRHLQRHMPDARNKQCPHCPFSAIRTNELKIHILYRHTKDSEIDWFRCDQCSHKSKSKYAFIKHTDSHRTVEEVNMYRTRKLTCDQCSKMFKRKSGLQRHVDFVHNRHKQKLLKCHLCDYTSYFLESFKLHVERKHGDLENMETLKCDKCSYTTKFQHLLKIHLTRHSKIIQCEKCLYQTNNMQKMKLHEINHQEVKDEKDLKYRCDKCDYKTYRHYSLSVHKLKHLKPEEIQYFYCYHCDFKAKRKDNLKTHINNHFKKKTEFVCYICDYKTNTKVSHIAHLGKHSREQNKKQNSKANHDDKKEKQKRQISSSNKNCKVPLKRRKVRKNDDDENEKSKINESVPHSSDSPEKNKKPSKSEVNHNDKKEKQESQSSSDTEKKAPLTRRKTRSIKPEIIESVPLKSKFMEDWLNVNKKSDHENWEQNETKGTDESLS